VRAGRTTPASRAKALVRHYLPFPCGERGWKVRADTIDQIVRGEANALVMRLQDKLHVAGNRALLYVMQRLFPAGAVANTRSAPPQPQHPELPSALVIAANPDGKPQKIPPSQTVSVLAGNTFVVSGRDGDIDAGPNDTQGLFSYDTRFLSRWLLTINGIAPRPLATDDLQYYAVQFFLVLATGSVYVDTKLSLTLHGGSSPMGSQATHSPTAHVDA
jgi:hypothetical protein